MQITVGQTQKRINSTSRVIYAGGTTLTNVRLKGKTSMQAPIFVVQGLHKETLFNYLKWEATDEEGEFDRYYWVDDVVYTTRHTAEIHCHLDPLATFRDAIDETRAYVKYGDSAHWNKYIDDFRFSPEKRSIGTAPATADEMSVLFPLFDDRDIDPNYNLFDTSMGTFIMTVMDTGSGASTHGVRKWAMNWAAVISIFQDLTGFLDHINNQYIGIAGTVIDAMQFLTKCWGALGGEGSWRENILSLIYVPIKIDVYAVGQSDEYQNGIYIGGVLSYPYQGVAGHIYNVPPQPLQKTAKTISIPWSYEAQNYDFLKCPRWGSMQVCTPSGYQEISLAGLHDVNNLGWESVLNIATGEWSGKLVAGTPSDVAVTLASFGGCLALNVLDDVFGNGQSFGGTFDNVAIKMIGAAFGSPQTVQTGTSHIKSSGITEHYDDNGNLTSSKILDEEKDVPVYHSESSGISGAILPTGVSAGCSSGSIGTGMTGFYLVESYIRGFNSNIGTGYVRMISYAPEFILTNGVVNGKYEDYCDLYGYPVNDFVQLQNINGYCCCVGASVEKARGASEANKATINSYLNTGIILEE